MAKRDVWEHEPRNINTDDSTRKIYKDLSSTGYSPFKGAAAAHKEIFMVAMAIGYHLGKRIPLKKKYGGFINYVSMTEDDRWIMRSIAVEETNSLKILSDEKGQKKVIKIAEEYANGGVKVLHKMLTEPGNYEKKLESELREIIESFGKKM